jgi:hypothetical protein
MPTIEINEWLQDDIENYIKERLLREWLIENDIPEDKGRDYYLSDPIGGYGCDAPSNPSYGSFAWSVGTYKQRDKWHGEIEISIRDALKLYLSDEE